MNTLPLNWCDQAVNSSVQYIGDDWARQQASLVLEVPSAVTFGEKNYLINVLHPDYPKLKFGSIDTFKFDTRIVK